MLTVTLAAFDPDEYGYTFTHLGHLIFAMLTLLFGSCNQLCFLCFALTPVSYLIIKYLGIKFYVLLADVKLHHLIQLI